MAGSFAEARTQILSLRPDMLRTKAEELRQFGIDAVLAGSTMGASADSVGAQRGAPYAAYRERVTPTATWLRNLRTPADATATGLDGAAGAADRARMVLAQQEQMLAAVSSAPGAGGGALQAAEAQALAALNGAIAEVTQAYGAITPPAPGTAPVVVAATGAGAGPGAAVGAGGRAAAAGLSGAAQTAPGGGALDAAAAGLGAQAEGGSSAVLGPEAGPFAGFVQDPITGNLIDPATGREVDAGGRFLDPITGQPFGESSPFATRLEGLVGGAAPVGTLGAGVPAAGVLGPAAAGVAPVGLGPAGAAAATGGVVPFVPPGAAVGAVGARRGTARFAGLYGGALPPSLAGPNPAGSQLNQIAARNLEQRADVAQRYAAIAAGQAPAQAGFFPPPVAGVGGGGMGAARSARRGGPRAVTEPAGVWGAVPGGGRGDRRRSSGSTAETEDDDVWTGGTAAAGLLDGR